VIPVPPFSAACTEKGDAFPLFFLAVEEGFFFFYWGGVSGRLFFLSEFHSATTAKWVCVLDPVAGQLSLFSHTLLEGVAVFFFALALGGQSSFMFLRRVCLGRRFICRGKPSTFLRVESSGVFFLFFRVRPVGPFPSSTSRDPRSSAGKRTLVARGCLFLTLYDGKIVVRFQRPTECELHAPCVLMFQC